MEGKSDISKMMEEIEINAVKRFAKKLKSKATVSTIRTTGHIVVDIADIDNLVKEMEGGIK